MRWTTLHLVTVIAEPVLEERITEDLVRLGATGFTVTEVRGRGSRGIRSGDVPGFSVRIEVIVSAPVADHILDRVRQAWFPHYAVIAWRSAVEVVRGEKYVRDGPDAGAGPDSAGGPAD